MFKRFIRAIKSLFGGFVSSMEDPKLILEQNIRELNDQIPQMNENITTVKANAMMLRKEVEKYEKSISEITSKIKSAIEADRDDLAEGYALQLEKAKENLQHSKQQLKYAEQAYEKALKVKQAFMREKDRKIKEAREALRASERAEWQAKVADALESFEMGGLDQTHSEMVNRLNEETARNEARMEIALESVDTETMEIEANAEKLRARELVNQFKLEMGKDSKAKEDKTIDIEEPAKTEKESQKTVGKEKTKS
ncbi:PspA/IM30 family protein [Rhodohalobacter sulfatireducens]|uniref:PspA/IM30 family protein n=1 Tax=Rhodohalobacter sulfatireducens TaxID=2911366 RepID=A0ABS9KFH4_9BACT|nr:PspA/IM30 family protein [Rhodohalobacter sulfatireducens]MCG2589560.1 PspA/IM30 family protein [Rhodohalobacter sulfatireducens]MDR9364926.1 PspA/IM30 family protein [Balneolaceae bacterium]